MDNTVLDLEAIEARCEALDERMSDMAWTLEGPNHYGLFSVYDSDGNAVSHGIRERQGFIAHARRDVPALLATVKQLYRKLHDERVRRDEWEQMNNRLIAGTEVERLRAECDGLIRECNALNGQLTQAQKDHECSIHVAREMNVTLTQSLTLVRRAMQRQSDEAQRDWLSPVEAEGLRRQLAKCNEEHDQLVDRVEDAMGQIARYETCFADNLIQYAVYDILERLVKVEQRAEKLTERLATLDAAEAALADCGISGVYDRFDGLADAIRQMVNRLVQLEGGQALQIERQLRQEAEQELKQRQRQIDLLCGAELRAHRAEQHAEQRAENLYAVLLDVHKVLTDDLLTSSPVPRRHRCREQTMSRALKEICKLAGIAQCDMSDVLEYGTRGKTEEEKETLKSIEIKLQAILRYAREVLEYDSETATQLAECLEKLDAAEAALADCGLSGIYDDFSGPADAIEQMVKRLVQLEGGQELQAERQLRREAERELRQRQHQIDLLSGAELRAHRAEQRTERAETAEVLEKELRGERDYWQRVADHEAKQGQKTRRDLIAERQECYALHAKIEIAEQRAERAEALAALVTPELASLLERIVNATAGWTSVGLFTSQDGEKCRAFAARIREALEANSEN